MHDKISGQDQQQQRNGVLHSDVSKNKKRRPQTSQTPTEKMLFLTGRDETFFSFSGKEDRLFVGEDTGQ
jgi:hypothetical protein